MFGPSQIKRTDLDTLERVVGIVAFGDLEGEDTCNLTHINFLRIFRLSQLTAEYLLHVQDHLAGENSHLKVSLCLSFTYRTHCSNTMLCVQSQWPKSLDAFKLSWIDQGQALQIPQSRKALR